MFTAKHIAAMLKAQPFRPFRIHTSGGQSYDILNHDSAWVTPYSVEVGMNVDPDGIAEYVQRVAILHIDRIADLQPAATT